LATTNFQLYTLIGFPQKHFTMINKPHSYSILAAIGNTPIVKLNNVVPANCASIFVKLEYLNPTGSYKDRMALAIIEEAEKRGDLRPEMTVVECTAGGTGTSLAFICSAKGYKFKVVSSDAFSKEKLQAMQIFGAELELVKSDDGKITPDLIPKMIERAKEISVQSGGYWTRQFENKDDIEGYRKMGKEILEQLDRQVNLFCAAVGTAGMMAGVSKELKQANSRTKVVVLEPASSPMISEGVKGSHKIEGIAVGFIPPLLQEAIYDEVRTVEESEARKMAKRLVSEEGILAGTSTGLNVVAAIELGKGLGPEYTIVTVACDSGMKYISSGLFA
jgi:cysteine synthase A